LLLWRHKSKYHITASLRPCDATSAANPRSSITLRARRGKFDHARAPLIHVANPDLRVKAQKQALPRRAHGSRRERAGGLRPATGRGAVFRSPGSGSSPP
jgi:hypothetical protein